jgi:hypothetical protein
MVSVCQFGAMFFALLTELSQANLLGDAHLLKRYPQADDLPPAATHLTGTTLLNNGSAIRTSIHILPPTSTRQLVDGSTLHSLHSFESTGVNTGTGTDGSIDDGTSEALSLPTRSISVPTSEGEGTPATPIEVDWTGLFPGTPSTKEPFGERHAS